MTRRGLSVLVACAGAVVVARVVTRFHWDPGLAALSGSWVPPDLEVFLRAGDALLQGDDLYKDVRTVGRDFGYVYPPLLALAISPLSVLPGSAAASVWTIFMAVSLVAGLRLLGVTDVRCYAGGARLSASAEQRSSTGRSARSCCLLVAATWTFRDRPARAALASGAAIATKLFLWPLAVWLLATKRSRAAAFSVVTTLALVLVPWAAIRFSGLAQYPELLDKVGARQGYRSYSVEALVQSLGASRGIAVAVSWALGLSVLVVGARVARLERLSQRDRDRLSLTAALAASLVLTPIVWVHYLVLGLIPVALAYPTFSAVWLASLASAVHRPVSLVSGVARTAICCRLRPSAALRDSAHRRCARDPDAASGLPRRAGPEALRWSACAGTSRRSTTSSRRRRADEVNAAALQYVRKVSGSAKPSKANEAVFARAVAEVAATTQPPSRRARHGGAAT